MKAERILAKMIESKATLYEMPNQQKKYKFGFQNDDADTVHSVKSLRDETKKDHKKLSVIKKFLKSIFSFGSRDTDKTQKEDHYDIHSIQSVASRSEEVIASVEDRFILDSQRVGKERKGDLPILLIHFTLIQFNSIQFNSIYSPHIRSLLIFTPLHSTPLLLYNVH